MIIDARNEFCSAGDMAQVVGTYFTGPDTGACIDLGVANNMGAGVDLYLVIQAITGLDSAGGAATVQFSLVSDSAIAFNATPSVHLSTKAFTEAEAVAGAVLFVGKIPVATAEPYERYLGVRFAIAGETSTVGTFAAFLTPTPAFWAAQADAI